MQFITVKHTVFNKNTVYKRSVYSHDLNKALVKFVCRHKKQKKTVKATFANKNEGYYAIHVVKG